MGRKINRRPDHAEEKEKLRGGISLKESLTSSHNLAGRKRKKGRTNGRKAIPGMLITRHRYEKCDQREKKKQGNA